MFMLMSSGAARGLALLCCMIAAPLAAQDVELRSLDGSVRLEGTLTAFDGAYYQITTLYGPLTIAAEGVACNGPGCPDLTSFVAEARIAGEATVIETLVPGFLAGFAQARGMVLTGPETGAQGLVYTLTRADRTVAARFTLTPGTSDSGFLALLNGETDIALTLRPPTEGESRADRDRAPGNPPLARRVRVIALDALVPVVSPRNPLAALSLPDLAAIVRGEIDNWQGLGGADAPVTLHLLAPDNGLAQSFLTRLLDGGAQDPAPGTIHASARALAAAVARDGYALGMAARSATGTARILPLVGACGLIQTADPDTIKAGDYPLTAPVYLYLAPYRLPRLVRDFLIWTETEAAAARVAHAGFIPHGLTRTALAQQGTRLANAVTAAGDAVPLSELQRLIDRLRMAERLSATLRFSEGSADLDPQSHSAVAHLAAAIEAGVFDGRRLIFVGFSDGEGPAAVNLRLSQRRAESVRAAVQRAAAAAAPGRVMLETDAFGAAMPIACDDSDRGRAMNRRVEVWLDGARAP